MKYILLALLLVGMVSALDITSPESRTYNTSGIILTAVHNATLDRMDCKLDHVNYTGCTNCTLLNTTLNVSEGDHLLIVRGMIGNETFTDEVRFRVAGQYRNRTRDEARNHTWNESRFGRGFEKLPKIVAAGNLTDDELADILRNNKLNPGVLNRLIKTGNLGNESIDAILDTQFQPQGFFRKLFNVKTAPVLIAEHYNLTDESKEKMLGRKDIPKKDIERFAHELNISNDAHLEKGKRNDSDNWTVERYRKSDSDKMIPPGQARKNDSGPANKWNDSNDTRIHPGVWNGSDDDKSPGARPSKDRNAPRDVRVPPSELNYSEGESMPPESNAPDLAVPELPGNPSMPGTN